MRYSSPASAHAFKSHGKLSELEILLLVPYMTFAVINSIALSSSLHVLTPVTRTPDTSIVPQEGLFS